MSVAYSQRALAGALLFATALASGVAHADAVQTVFVISMENHNFTQPTGCTPTPTGCATVSGTPQQLLGNPVAPFQNSLINGTATATINGMLVNISQSVAYAANYQAVPPQANGSVHPSEPNYIWAEAGTNFGVRNDNQPYAAVNPTNQNTTQHLTGLMQQQGVTWKSYQEDIDLASQGGQNSAALTSAQNSGNLTNTVLPQSQWVVPLTNFAGTSASYTNQYNGSHQFDYGAKHNPQVFFSDTNGGNNNTPSNPEALHYAPLQQLQTDLNNNTVAKYNWISPDQFNDSHTALGAGFDYKGQHLTGDSAAIAQGDNFLSQIIPMIMASDAYKNNGAIIIWWDETEGPNADDANHTLEEIVISNLAHPNVNGLPYASPTKFTHSSDLRTMEEIFGVFGAGDTLLADAANATDLGDLFAPNAVPEPEQELPLLALAIGGLAYMRRRKR